MASFLDWAEDRGLKTTLDSLHSSRDKDEDLAVALAIKDALRNSRHPIVRALPDRESFDRFVAREAHRRRYAEAVALQEANRPILQQRLCDLARDLERAHKAAVAVPRENAVTAEWQRQLSEMLEQVRNVPDLEKRDPRVVRREAREGFVFGVVYDLSNCPDTAPLTWEPEGFLSLTVEALASVAGFDIPSEPKERRDLIRGALDKLVTRGLSGVTVAARSLPDGLDTRSWVSNALGVMLSKFRGQKLKVTFEDAPEPGTSQPARFTVGGPSTVRRSKRWGKDGGKLP